MMRCRPIDFGLLWLLAGLWMSAAAAQEGSDELMQPRDVARLDYVSSVAVSPAGEHAAYTLSVPRRVLDEDDGPAWSELYVVNLQPEAKTDDDGAADSYDPRPFITGQVSIGKPHWSPDGRWIYYTAKRGDDDEQQLYRIAVDGGESIPTLTHPTSIQGFDLAPDGRRVAILAKPKTTDDQESLQEKGFNQEIYEEDWKPTEVWIAEIDAESTSASNTADARKLELQGSASAVAWSPSGNELMVVLAPTPSVDDSYMFQRVRVAEASTGRLLRAIENPGKLGAVAWSPDGKHLAMVSGVDINDPREGRLMVVPVDGDGELRDLMPELDAHIGAIAWRSESEIVWLAADGVHSRMGIVNLDGQRRDLLEPPPSSLTGSLTSVDADAMAPTVFTDFSAAAKGERIALIGNAKTHPAELFVAGDVTSEPQRVTNSNPWLSDRQFARQVAVRYRADDGVEIGGVLVYPLNYVAGRRYPTIMYVHGGPESHVSNGWVTSYTQPGQVAAARGFAVFYPNYRGSTGRGVEFSMLGQADAAGKEFDDLIDGIDFLIEQGLADSSSIGVTGGSYGGYASAWCATYYSERFAASVMFVGISDNVSKVGTTDIPEEMFLVHHRKRLWDDWEYFLDRSPIKYVQRHQTPILILHGKNDPRVHPSQSLELHRHLKTLDQAPVRLVLYEGEGHGNRKAAARLDYNLRMLRWMEHFLQDDAEQAPEMTIDYRQAIGKPKENPMRE